MPAHRTRVDRNGRIVLPAAVRRQLGVKTGDEIVLTVSEHEVRLTTHRAALGRLQRLVREQIAPGSLSVEQFLKEKRVEAEREERAWQKRYGRKR